MPTDKTEAQRRSEENRGIMSKSYKLSKAVVKAFKAACVSQGVAQSAVLTTMMWEYIRRSQNNSEMPERG
jgi:hypothetical protein